MRILGYARISIDADNSVSIEDQTSQIKSFAHAFGHELVDIFADDGVSGSLEISEREAGRQLLKTLQAGDTLVITKLDRAFRNTQDCIETINLLNKRGVGLVILNMSGQMVDTSSAMGKFMITLMASLGELELETTKERTKASLKFKKDNRKAYCHSVFGWTREGDFLTRNEQEQSTIKAIVQAREDGFSYQAIANALNEAGAPTKKGGLWSKRTVYSVFINETMRDFDDIEAIKLDFVIRKNNKVYKLS